MKQIILLILVSIDLYGQSKNATKFSNVFTNYSEKYKFVIVQYSGGFYGQKYTHYRVIYKEKQKWFLVDQYVSPIKLFSDSVVINKCDTCAVIFRKLQLEIKELKSENEITMPCRKFTSIATGRGDSAVSERDLNLETNVGSQFVEYRIKTIRSIVWQRTPEVALAICPESKERRRFSDLVNAIKCAH